MNRTIILIVACSFVLELGCSKKKAFSSNNVAAGFGSSRPAEQIDSSKSDTATRTPSISRVAWVKAGARDCFKAFFSPDGNILVSVNSLGTQIWSVPSGQFLRLLPIFLGYGSYPLAFTHDGNDLFFGDSANLKCWHVASNSISPVLFRQRRVIRSLAFSRDGNTLLSAGDDSTVVALDLKDSVRVRQTYKVSDGVWQAQFADDDKFIAVRYGYRARIVDVANGKVVRDFKAQGMSVSPTGDLIVLASRGKRNERKYSKLDIQNLSGTSHHSISFKQNDGPSEIALASSGRYLFASSEDGYLRKYNATTGSLLVSVSEDVHKPFGLSNNGDFAAIGAPSGFGIWNLTTGSPVGCWLNLRSSGSV